MACFALEPAMRQTDAVTACGAPTAPACRWCTGRCTLSDAVWFSRDCQQWPVYVASTARCPACQTVDACVWSKRCADAPWVDDTECARVRGDNLAYAARCRGPLLSTTLVRHLSVREVALLGGVWQFTVPFEARQVTLTLALDDSERTHSCLLWRRTERHHSWTWYFLWPQHMVRA